jgi:hypothetical protein
VVEFRVVTE